MEYYSKGATIAKGGAFAAPTIQKDDIFGLINSSNCDSSKFDHPLTGCYRIPHGLALLIESRQQHGIAAVAKSNPYQSAAVVWTAHEYQEVFVLADNDAALGASAVPDDQVVCFIETDIEDMNNIQPPSAKVDSQFERELVIHQQFHEAWSRRDAYAMAARMSSRSRKA